MMTMAWKVRRKALNWTRDGFMSNLPPREIAHLLNGRRTCGEGASAICPNNAAVRAFSHPLEQ
jgi:hypothetical protein